MINLVVYLPNSYYLNEATSFYIDMVCEGLSNQKPKIVHELSGLNKFDAVFVIDAKSFLFVKMRYPTMKIITWYQGIVPEEALMTLNSRLRYRVWSALEFFALNFSLLNIFVSSAMKNHYEHKYNYNNKRDIIIPCFNKKINSDSYSYSRGLSFVYAGSLHKWQCIERLLNIFKLIQIKEPAAALYFYTFNVNQARDIIKKYALCNVTLESVGLEEIDVKISKSKYGFLIRDDHVVNNVATPTKMSTYLSVGTKPILTDVFHDFTDYIDPDTCIFLDNAISDEDAADAILIDYYLRDDIDRFVSARDKVFEAYFNRSLYVKNIKQLVVDILSIKTS